MQVSKQDKFNLAITFLRSLRSAMEALAIDPILVDTGQHEPIYDKPRTYADVHNQTASTLANLPKFIAQAKIVGLDGRSVEYTVKTIAPDQGLKGVALKERVARIRAQNIRTGYLRERAKVEEEIKKRQEQCLQSSQQQAQQPAPAGARRILLLVCPKCGVQYRQGAKFCNQCGNAV